MHCIFQTVWAVAQGKEKIAQKKKTYCFLFLCYFFFYYVLLLCILRYSAHRYINGGDFIPGVKTNHSVRCQIKNFLKFPD